jgi:hypothetical protein
MSRGMVCCTLAEKCTPSQEDRTSLLGATHHTSQASSHWEQLVGWHYSACWRSTRSMEACTSSAVTMSIVHHLTSSPCSRSSCNPQRMT